MATGTRWLLIGGGSNLLVGDAGFRGLVIVNKIEHLVVDGTRIVAGAGRALAAANLPPAYSLVPRTAS
jgi:UDP-N-acetylenolpyruvoylglucosamine reductase